MNWLVVLDPLDGLMSKTDTSVALIVEARKRGIIVETATLDTLFFDGEAGVLATTAGGETKRGSLAAYDIIFMRKEPPYDLAFHYATQLLDLSGTLVVNSPESLQGFNEKLIALHFPELMPPTLVSSDPTLLLEFLEKHQICVLKSLDSFQGKAVRRVEAVDPEAHNHLRIQDNHPVMLQRFLDNVYQGDKRVIMLGDRVIGAALRRPKKGYHANFANSDALQTGLTEQERLAIDLLGPWMVERGIHFSGLDFIGGQLTEINITCPTGVVQISELDGTNLPGEMVDYFSDLATRQRAR
jgi:glutathione synthase